MSDLSSPRSRRQRWPPLAALANIGLIEISMGADPGFEDLTVLQRTVAPALIPEAATMTSERRRRPSINAR